MLIPVRLTDQWSAIERDLPADWAQVRARVRPEQAADLDAAARLLGSLGAGRVGEELALTIVRAGGTASPEAARRAFERMDEARVWCELELGDVAEGSAPRDEVPRGRPLAEAWDAELAHLPSDWSDVLCLLRIESSSLLDRAALLIAPVNPARDGDAVAFTFRAARRAGYGASSVMVRRCLERLDEEGILGEVSVLRQLSDTDRVATQGPVWLVGGRHL